MFQKSDRKVDPTCYRSRRSGQIYGPGGLFIFSLMNRSPCLHGGNFWFVGVDRLCRPLLPNGMVHEGPPSIGELARNTELVMARTSQDTSVTIDWLSRVRLSEQGAYRDANASAAADSPEKTVGSFAVEVRTPAERDYDRLLFSAPVRRMADKTQVFPLDKNDSVRTRLTHSHEVSNLARSIGLHVLRQHGEILGLNPADAEAVPVILAAIGLAHDLGNPPFGHQGEAAIGEWFERNLWVFDRATADGEQLQNPVVDQQDEFLKFEGNAQTLRLLARLQVQRDAYGLDLTMGTLAALMKYTVPCTEVGVGEAKAANKKYGYFASECDVFSTVCDFTGLNQGERHPLAWLMEACDDIAYSVLDVEDSVKKRIASYQDLFASLSEASSSDSGDAVMKDLVDKLRCDVKTVEHKNLSPNEKNDVNIELFRVRAIKILVESVVETFAAFWPAIKARTHKTALLETGAGRDLTKFLKNFAFRHAYTHRSVLEVELQGRAAIMDLMDWFWIGISDRKCFDDPASKRSSAFARFIYQEISENYRRLFETHEATDAKGRPLPIRYRELRLLTDMIAGMTDTFAVEAHQRLAPIYADYARHK